MRLYCKNRNCQAYIGELKGILLVEVECASCAKKKEKSELQLTELYGYLSSECDPGDEDDGGEK